MPTKLLLLFTLNKFTPRQLYNGVPPTLIGKKRSAKLEAGIGLEPIHRSL